MEHHALNEVVCLLLIACAVGILVRWIKQPYTIALVLVGVVVAVLKLTPHLYISRDIIFTLILPPLLFHGAMHMDLERLRINWKPILLLAIPGVICSTFFIGLILHQLLGLELLYAFLFGALITPTDPISVLAILKKVGAPERLRNILEGESLFNDGTGVVVFSIILGMITTEAEFSLSSALGQFIVVTGGGIFIGLLSGYLVYALLKQIDDHLLEVAITVVLTFGTPLLADVFHVSGIIAIVVAGLIIGNFGRIHSMSDKTREVIESFWEVIEFLINSILFLVIGVELQVIGHTDLSQLWRPVGIVLLTVLVSRCIVVYPIVAFKNMISRNDIPWPWSHILFWGGLRGSLSIALVVGLPVDIVYRKFFLALAFATVLFTLIVQGLTMKPLIKRLGLSLAADDYDGDR